MKSGIRFTHIEAVIITAVLLSAAVNYAPRLSRASNEDRAAELIDALHSVRSALDLYRAEHKGDLPPTDDFRSFTRALAGASDSSGPYIRGIPDNPFNGKSRVRFDGAGAGAGLAGWRLDTHSGSFRADHDPDYASL